MHALAPVTGRSDPASGALAAVASMNDGRARCARDSNRRRDRLADRRLGSGRGAELIEFAFVLPLLLVVIAGIVDFGFMFQRYLVVTNAAREGARIAVLPGYGLADVQARVQAYVRDGLGDETITPTTTLDTVTIDPPGPAPSFEAARVVVRTTHAYLVLGPLVSLIGGGSFGTLTLTARSTMRAEAGS
jgi:Flp pilus assembly protein TadG